MRKAVCSLLTVAVLFAGCAGREANPVQSYIPGDEAKSCVVLKAEMAQIEAEVAARLPNSDKSGGNLVLGAAGCFFFPLWFFMDLKGADQVEVKALQRRYNSLGNFAAEKGCVVSGEVEATSDATNVDTEAMKAEIVALKRELESKTEVESEASRDDLSRTLNNMSESDIATTGADNTQM